MVRGLILTAVCRYHEFRVIDCDDHDDRTTLVVETVASGRLRDFFGFNRARHAVVEAAILATRAAWLPPDDLRADLRRLEPLVAKTGGPEEHEAFAILTDHIDQVLSRREK